MHREILPILIIVLMFSIGIYVEPRITGDINGNIISHWNINGTPDGWIGKDIGLFMIPAITAFFYLFFMLIPRIEVYKKNLEEFAPQFWGFRVVFVFVMCAIYIAMLIPNLGYWTGFDPVLIVISAVALMFFYVGYMLNFTKRNYFIGVKTPWTLASEKVWDKTNKLTGKLFWVAGVLAFATLIAPSDYRLWILFAPLAAIVIVGYVYSLLEYNKLKKEQKNKPAAGKKGKRRKR
jgi:uncharacterized membrane protein